MRGCFRATRHKQDDMSRISFVLISSTIASEPELAHAPSCLADCGVLCTSCARIDTSTFLEC